jgi:murein DD-endopeptidase MepM/ murein hydrolase activator NlpD
MIHSLRERLWNRIHSSFPERQLYLRTNGRVQFFAFSPLFQATLAGFSLLVLGWMAFTSVNVIFRDHILTAKERRLEQLQASYETRIADLQLSYDELNGTLLRTEDRFKAMADTFAAKQQVLAEIVEHKAKLDAALAPVAKPLQQTGDATPTQRNAGMGGALEPLIPITAAVLAPTSADASSAGLASQTDVQSPAPLPATPPPPQHGAFLRDAMQRFGALFRHKIAVHVADTPVLHGAEIEARRIARLEIAAPALLGEAQQDVDKDVARLTKALRRTGLNSKTLIARVAARPDESGDPLMAAAASEIAADDGAFGTQLSAAMGSVQRLDQVFAVLSALPLAEPVDSAYVSSGFGARVDPFNDTLAFHSGMDFSAPLDSDVHVTAPGIVVFAGKKGAYGNSVEVDHGYGVRTRYGHLEKILVVAGQRLQRGDVIGKLGSTGRSTGPHVHYEVWYDDAVRDPQKFIKAGQNVLQE